MYIRLGIGGYSKRSQAASERFAARHGLALHQVDLDAHAQTPAGGDGNRAASRQDERRLDDQRSGDPDPLALAARELVREVASRLRPEADSIEDARDPCFAVAAVAHAVDHEPLGHDVADPHAWVERGERILEDDLHVLAQPLGTPAVLARDLLALEPDLAACGRHQADQRPPQGRLAAARLAHEADRFAGGDLEVDTIDRVNLGDDALEDALADRKVGLQVADLDQRFRAHTVTFWPTVARRPPSQSQQADSWASTFRSGG